jgi:hypothetical protein
MPESILPSFIYKTGPAYSRNPLTARVSVHAGRIQKNRPAHESRAAVTAIIKTDIFNPV